MVTNVYAGLISTSGLTTALNTATFDNLLISTSVGNFSRISSTLSAETENPVVNKFHIYPNPSNGMLEILIVCFSEEAGN